MKYDYILSVRITEEQRNKLNREQVKLINLYNRNFSYSDIIRRLINGL